MAITKAIQDLADSLDFDDVNTVGPTIELAANMAVGLFDTEYNKLNLKKSIFRQLNLKVKAKQDAFKLRKDSVLNDPQPSIKHFEINEVKKQLASTSYTKNEKAQT